MNWPDDPFSFPIDNDPFFTPDLFPTQSLPPTSLPTTLPEAPPLRTPSDPEPSDDPVWTDREFTVDIEEIYHEMKSNEHFLQEILREQKIVLAESTEEKLFDVRVRHNFLEEKLNNQIATLEFIYRSFLIDLHHLHQLYYTEKELRIQLRHLQLLKYELEGHLVNPLLVVYKEPFPEVIFKNQRLGNDVLVVKILSCAMLDLNSAGFVKGYFSRSPDLASSMLGGDEQPLNPISKEASFPLQFIKGTAMKEENLIFSTTLELVNFLNGEIYHCRLDSEPSGNFIVITNESQWEEAERHLLIYDIFGTQTQSLWIIFCNTLQRHFFRASRQDSFRTFRALEYFDFNYIQARFFRDPEIISISEFNSFWQWFGKTLKEIRYQRYINKLWQNGIIYGFLSKENVNEVLSGKPPGTFVIRFSESKGGRWAIGYVGFKDTNVKHYLVKSEDTNPQKTLVDFICEANQFITLMQFTSLFDEYSRPIFKGVPKRDILQPYLSPSSQNHDYTEENGYDPLENPLAGISLPTQGRRKKRKLNEIY